VDPSDPVAAVALGVALATFERRDLAT